MPPKSKRLKQCQESLIKARRTLEERNQPLEDSASSMNLSMETTDDLEMEDLLKTPDTSLEELDTDDEEVDASFSIDSSIKSDIDHVKDTFCENWVGQLERDDLVSLGLFLTFQLSNLLQKKETEAAELAGIMIGKSDRTIREWKAKFLETGEIPESKQGHYRRTGVLWNNEDLNKKATQYIRSNASVKGQPNLTVAKFCRWVNEDFLPNQTLEPGFPRKISNETARTWMHQLGFAVVASKKGAFVDGHERQDVVEYRKKFLRKMIALGFLNSLNAPTDQAKLALPHDLQCPSEEILSKTVIFFHDESTFQSNEDQPTLWAMKDTKVLKPKSRGAGIMVSDFIDERNGYLQLTEEEYQKALENDPNTKLMAREFLEYGEGKEGYWTSDKFMQQIEKAYKIAEIKYPKANGWRHVWIFDHSSCHAAMPHDALDVNAMNVKPGGKQRVMRDGFWNGKVQKMNFSLGVPKGLRVVLEERGINTKGLGASEMRGILSQHDDFKNEKSKIERYLEGKGDAVHLLPKYHCELNPIERVWAQSKRYTKAYCNYSIISLQKNITPALESVSLENIQNYFSKVRQYMFAYLESIPGGSDLEKLVKDYKKATKSHRRISDRQ